MPGFPLNAISDWAKCHLCPGSAVSSDGLACFSAVTRAGCSHEAIVVGGRKPNDVPEFLCVNTVLGNLKTSLKGAYHSFAFREYATRYLSAFAYRFIRRFDLRMDAELAAAGRRGLLPTPSGALDSEG